MKALFETLSFIRQIRNHTNPYQSEAFSAMYHKVIAPSVHEISGKLLVDQVALEVPQGGRVLEVGCGSGISAADLARRRRDVSVVASDLNESIMGVAQQGSPSNLTWQQADAMRLPFDSETFDAVFSANALKHFNDPRHCVAEMLRVARPGGFVLVCEISPWVDWQVSFRLTENMPLPAPLRPLLAAKARYETSRFVGDKNIVQGWFQDHEDAEEFAGLKHLKEASGGALPIFMATLQRRATSPTG